MFCSKRTIITFQQKFLQLQLIQKIVKLQNNLEKFSF